MSDAQAVAVIAAILYVGNGIDRQLMDMENALKHHSSDLSSIGFVEAIAHARDLLALAQAPIAWSPPAATPLLTAESILANQDMP